MSSFGYGSMRKDLTSPCKGCRDRYTACQDSCTKPEYIQVLANRERLRQVTRAEEDWKDYDRRAYRRRYHA